jgi:hypothetical protein
MSQSQEPKDVLEFAAALGVELYPWQAKILLLIEQAAALVRKKIAVRQSSTISIISIFSGAKTCARNLVMHTRMKPNLWLFSFRKNILKKTGQALNSTLEKLHGKKGPKNIYFPLFWMTYK